MQLLGTWRKPVVALGCALITLSTLSFAQEAAVEKQVARYLATAQQAERAQDYRSASHQYEEILKLKPKMPLIRQSLGVTYHLQNRYLDAIAEFRKAVSLDATMWGSYLFLGMDYYKSNQFELAIAPLAKSIELNAPMAEPEGRFWLAVTYSALDKQEDALRELRRDLELRPNNIDVIYYLTKAYDQAAAASFERLGHVDPHAAAVSLLQAERFVEENRRDLAKVEYRKAILLRPEYSSWISGLSNDQSDDHGALGLTISAADARATLDWASLLQDAGDVKASSAALHTLAALNASSPDAAPLIKEARSRFMALDSRATPVASPSPSELRKAIDLVKQGHFQEARAPLEHELTNNSNPSLQLLFLRAYLEAGDCKLAEDRLRQSLAVNPNDVDALHLLGRAYKRQAEQSLRRLMELDSDSYGVHELLGKQHEERTEYELAIKEYQTALAKRPETGGIRYAIGNVYRKMSQFGEAERWLKDELERNPYHGLAHYRLGSIDLEQHKVDDAISHLEIAVRFHPHLLDARLDLARAYTAKGRYQDAVIKLKEVAVLDPANDRVHYLLSAAYSKAGRRGEAQTELAEYQRLTRSRLQNTQQDIKSAESSLDPQ